MKKNIYLIIGHGRCGKSSLVRALTGKYKNGPCQIRSAYHTNMDFMVWANSCQDADKSPEKVLKEINNVGFENILLTCVMHLRRKLPVLALWTISAC